MNFYDSDEGVDTYFQMMQNHDGRFLIEQLKKYVVGGSKILELGIGTGKDLDIMSMNYTVTGSDTSKKFLQRYQQMHIGCDLLLLDAKTMDTDRKFDCIYSNKVLIHLTREEAKESLKKQLVVLNEGGVVLHSFWKGVKDEVIEGELFTRYTFDSVKEIIPQGYEVLELNMYKEIEENDSIYMILKKK